MSVDTSQAAPSTPGGAVRNHQWLLRRIRSNPRLAANLGVLVLVGAYLQYETGVFLSGRNLQSISMAIAVVTILAFSQTLVLIAGQIDISILGVISFAGVLGAIAARDGHSMEVAILVAVAAGLAVGIVNAILYLVFDVTALIATIATLYLSYGVANLVTNGIPVTQVPEEFSKMGNGFIGEIPIVVPIVLGFYLLFAFVEKKTVLGRYVVAVGSNREAAYDNGINVRRILLIIYLVSGATAGFAALLYASRISSATPAMDTTLLFQVIVACVIGGSGMTGGEGSITGTLIGSVLIGVIYNGLNLLGVATWWQPIALGVLLAVTVSFSGGFRARVAGLVKRRRGVRHASA